MGTLMEDYERMAQVLRGVTDHEVKVEGTEGVYVNFAFSEALVLETAITPDGQKWSITAYAWDRTGGVSADLEIGCVHSRYVPGMVRTFLEAQAKQESELEALLEQMPEE